MSKSDGSTADYYVLPEGATQLQDLISHRNMNAQIGEIFRAGYRYGMASHSDMLRDAKKIRFYAQAEVKRLEKLGAASEQCGQAEAQQEETSNMAIWADAPEWAVWLASDEMGSAWFENKPQLSAEGIFHNDDADETGKLQCVSGSPEGQKPSLTHRPTSTAK